MEGDVKGREKGDKAGGTWESKERNIKESRGVSKWKRKRGTKEGGREDMSEGNSEVSNLERERCQSQHPLYCLVPPQYSETGGILWLGMECSKAMSHTGTEHCCLTNVTEVTNDPSAVLDHQSS